MSNRIIPFEDYAYWRNQLINILKKPLQDSGCLLYIPPHYNFYDTGCPQYIRIEVYKRDIGKGFTLSVNVQFLEDSDPPAFQPLEYVKQQIMDGLSKIEKD